MKTHRYVITMDCAAEDLGRSLGALSGRVDDDVTFGEPEAGDFCEALGGRSWTAVVTCADAPSAGDGTQPPVDHGAAIVRALDDYLDMRGEWGSEKERAALSSSLNAALASR